MPVNPEVGSHVLHYRLIRRLGSGGMGEVFLAEDGRLHRQVAIKFLLGASDDQQRQRFLQEARAVAALDHPAICAVHEISSDPAHGDFIVMQFVEGEALSDRLKRGSLRPDEALTLAARIAEALVAAHAKGIVHRDLKPQNVIVTPSGSPKLLDFGLATRVSATTEAAEVQTALRLTQPHTVMGTPGYMSPEQVRGQPADARSDLFTLGCLLYECFTSRRAFTGGTSADVAAAVLHVDPPSASSIVSELDASHDALISRLMKKAPVDRFQSAADALGAIRALAPTLSGSGSAPVAVAARPEPRARWPKYAIAIGITAGLAVLAMWQWPWRPRLPEPPADAAQWYARGVDAIREGTYASARSSLEEAVRLYPGYVRAYSRLAEAHSELDDERGAQNALLRVSALVPDLSSLDDDSRLRLDAVRASVLRDHVNAVDAYRRLAERHLGEAVGWLDLGRAEEAASRLPAAAEHYAKALGLDSQYAAAHLRLGVVQAQTGQLTPAMAAFDEAIRLYRVAGHVEGEAEVLLRKGVLLKNRGKYAEAGQALQRVLLLASDPRFVSQRVRARVELARLTATEGRPTEAEAAGSAAVREATDAGLYGLAANGLIDLANTLTLTLQYSAADAHLSRAIDLAGTRGARRTEARAQLQQASLRLQTGQLEDALRLSGVPLRFFAEHRYVRAEADGKNVQSRAYEGLGNYVEAARLATEVLRLAESVADDLMIAVSLENLAGQLTLQGRLPEALIHRERIEKIHRAQNDHATLAYDLTSRAELLIYLGRGDEATVLLDEIADRIAAGPEVYRARRRRLALLRALLDTTTLRFAGVDRHAADAVRPNAPATPTPSGGALARPDSTALFAMVLREHAIAQLGRPGASATALIGWLRDASSPALRRELSYWVAQTLLARREYAQAYSLASATWSDTGTQGNAELRWRLAAVAGLAARTLSVSPNGPEMLAHATAGRQAVEAAWPERGSHYFARPDFALLRSASTSSTKLGA